MFDFTLSSRKPPLLNLPRLPKGNQGGEEFGYLVGAGALEGPSEGLGSCRASGCGQGSAEGLGLLGEGFGPGSPG